MTDEQLRGLIEADDLGLIAIKAKRTPQSSEEERVLEGFRQILDFVEARGTAPAKLAADMNERLLHARLTAIRGNPAWREKLLPFDKEFELLAVDEESAPLTIDDLLNDDFLDSLEAEASDIFDLKHLPNPKDIEGPDYVAQRTSASSRVNSSPAMPISEPDSVNCCRSPMSSKSKRASSTLWAASCCMWTRWASGSRRTGSGTPVCALCLRTAPNPTCCSAP